MVQFECPKYRNPRVSSIFGWIPFSCTCLSVEPAPSSVVTVVLLFVLIFIILIFILGSPISYYPREWKREKGIHPKVDETRGFLYLGHSNWTIWSLLSWFRLQIIPSSWSSYWGVGSPISYYPREWKWEKGIHPKLDETQGFLYLGHSNWTICSLLSWFCHTHFPSSWSLYWGVQFLITPESGNGKKGFTQKWMRHRGFCTWGIQTGPVAVDKADFVPKFFQLPDLYTGTPFLITPQLKMRKRDSNLPQVL